MASVYHIHSLHHSFISALYAGEMGLYLEDKVTLAYVIGVALGDGNLSRVGKATRLRITCDLKYPQLIREIRYSIQKVAPKNSVSMVYRRFEGCVDISCYSKKWPEVLGWNIGSKHEQNVCVPEWIKKEKIYVKACLKGLFQTDGSIYSDRGYLMVNFTSSISTLAKDSVDMIKQLGFKPTIGIFRSKHYRTKYTIRISKNSSAFLKEIDLRKE